MIFLHNPPNMVFQSTLPVRGATGAVPTFMQEVRISIHAPRAGSDVDALKGKGQFTISIHAPRAGSDMSHTPFLPRHRYFNPRSPCGERQVVLVVRVGKRLISIHAPRAGSDLPAVPQYSDDAHFNPRSPCGERPPQCWRGR